MSDYLFRPMEPDDEPFVISSWLTSAGKAWDALRGTLAERFPGVTMGAVADVPHRFTRRVVTDIMARPTVKIVVAADLDDPTVIFGFIVAEPGVVHWVHVKHIMRRQGLAAALCDAVVPEWRDGVTCTYLGRAWMHFAARWPLRFDPNAGASGGRSER